MASKAVTIEDDPLDPGGSGAEPFDAEGTPTRRRELIAKGELRGFLADAYWGRKIGIGIDRRLPPSGAESAPHGGDLQPAHRSRGAHSPSELFAAVGNGILLTEFLGIHTADPVSGDFSVGASGIRIAGGSLAEPLHGFAVAGNILGLLEKVEAAGSDFRWFGNVGAPSLMVSAISVGGE